MNRHPDIFLSYSRDDQARAKLFAEAFEREGFRVWWDVGLRAGEAYDTVTETALKTAKAVVVLWSKRSVESRWVRAEATLADRNKTLVPAMIEVCERPIMFELTQTAELMHWQGDADDKGWRGFLGDVRRFIAKDAAPVETGSVPASAAPTVEETLKPGQSGAAPSLAVLPFINRSSNPDDQVFAEGMVEDLISALAQGSNVRVLGSMVTANLSRVSLADPALLGRQLGVRYLLEGNVRRVGNNLRVATQLIDALTGEVAWTNRFERPLSELAVLQEELATELAGSLDTEVYNLEMSRALKKPRDLTAWEAVARCMSAYRRFDREAMLLATREAESAVALAPDYGPGHAMLAVALIHEVIFLADPSLQLNRVPEITRKAVELAPDDLTVLVNAGYALALSGDAREGLRLTQAAIRKAPGNGLAHHYQGVCLLLLGRFGEAISSLKTACRLMPRSHLLVFTKIHLSRALAALGSFSEAEAAVDEAVAIDPMMGVVRAAKALFCLQRGDVEEAIANISMARRAGWSAVLAERAIRFGFEPDKDRRVEILRSLYAASESADDTALKAVMLPDGRLS